MYTIQLGAQFNNGILIPIRYNITCVMNNSKHGYEFEKYFLTNIDVTSLVEENQEESCMYIWDFQDMEYANDRSFDVLKEHLIRKKNVCLINLKKGSRIYDIVKATFTEELILESHDDISNFYISEQAKKTFESLNTERLVQEKLGDLVKRYTRQFDQSEGRKNYIVSSGIYSSCQIDFKNAFYNHNDIRFIIYLLYQKIVQVTNLNFDYLVATSKNGVALASILGDIFKKDVLCFNIGQMFEEAYHRMPQVEPQKKYLHIFDVICLGSETKVINALINAQKGVMPWSVGIICLLDLDAVRKNNRYSAINNVRPLIELRNIDLNYDISFNEED